MKHWWSSRVIFLCSVELQAFAELLWYLSLCGSFLKRKLPRKTPRLAISFISRSGRTLACQRWLAKWSSLRHQNRPRAPGYTRSGSCRGPIKKVARLRHDIRPKRVTAEKRGRRIDRHLMGHCCGKASQIVGGHTNDDIRPCGGLISSKWRQPRRSRPLNVFAYFPTLRRDAAHCCRVFLLSIVRLPAPMKVTGLLRVYDTAKARGNTNYILPCPYSCKVEVNMLVGF